MYSFVYILREKQGKTRRYVNDYLHRKATTGCMNRNHNNQNPIRRQPAKGEATTGKSDAQSHIANS